ncbi:type IV pilus assembly protein PilO [Neobacillus niacini]|uniref:pilus assembly protein PilO n=1 Tax=Neobacillus niacini TaxID=86668 RepID=UPI0027816CAE|nr:pilus assembly protein PilO [Neobacillus niacini]MDQ1001335.1 type IV pilus assembly protein PilO [Neobacillus niacini]
MKLGLSKLDKIILLAGSFLLVLVIVYGQFLKLTPLKSDVSMKEQSLNTEQKLLEAVTQNKIDETTKVVEDTRELQKKVPVKPLLEQFILDLEKAEIVSNSVISSMSFTKDEDVILATETPAENAPADQVGTTGQETATPPAQTGEAPQEPAAAANGQPAAAPVSNGLKKLSVSLSVESPTYEDLEKFIATLESLERIVVIESISYTGGKEITSLELELEKLQYSITVSAYYLPILDDLIAELPKIDAPAPANKKNPLSSFSDTTKAN